LIQETRFYNLQYLLNTEREGLKDKRSLLKRSQSKFIPLTNNGTWKYREKINK